MKASNSGLAFIAAREALCLTAYKDTHHLAIGFGENDDTLSEGTTVTLEEAVSRYLKRIEAEEKSLNIILKECLIEQHHFDALLSLQWNIGPTALKGNQRLVSAVEVFGRNRADRGIRDWTAYQITHANFSETKGPFNFSRRCREALVFISGDYGDISTVQMWGAGKNPRRDASVTIPMPVFRS